MLRGIRMKFKRQWVAMVVLLLIALGACRCTSRQNNTNQSAANPPKPGRWVAQYRSPESSKYKELNLNVFSYSGISVVSRDVVFACGDVPRSKTTEERTGVILRTTDGGQSWTEKLIELPGFQIPTLNA